MTKEKQAISLLYAAYSLLKNGEAGPLEIYEEEVFYDGVMCNGYSLLDEIEDFFYENGITYQTLNSD